MRVALIEKYRQIRDNLFRWYLGAAIGYKIVLSLSMASLTGLAAQIRIPLPFTPVPITGQTLAVLLSGVVLGSWGGISQLFYVGLGIIGVPWFAGWGRGITHLAGPTGGYIAGFILASFFIGKITTTHVKSRNFLSLLLLMLVANFLFIHGLGLFHLYLWFVLVKANPVSLLQLFKMGTLPFIPGDITKIIVAALLGRALVSPASENSR